MVEPQIVVLVVAGSSPVDHPWYFRFSSADFRFRGKDRQVLRTIGNLKSKIANFTVPVAQPDRASDFGSTQSVLHSFAKHVFHREIR
jgi:hypothetical protein